MGVGTAMNGAGGVAARAVFLDRDGVLNRAIVRDGKPYPPASLEELEIVEDAPASLARLKNLGFLLLVVTNQPDVARGTQTLETVQAIHESLRRTASAGRLSGLSPRRPGCLPLPQAAARAVAGSAGAVWHRSGPLVPGRRPLERHRRGSGRRMPHRAA